jgi:hypothetical protein
MRSDRLLRMRRWALPALLSLILVALLANCWLLVRVDQQLAHIIEEDIPRKSLPCAAIPTRFVLEEPGCAQRLLEFMNVSKVRIVPRKIDAKQ